MRTERQSAENRTLVVLRINKIIPNVTAPDATLTVANVAESMSSCPKAKRQSNELAANASIAMAVSNAVRAEISSLSRGRTEPPLNPHMLK